ncbi:hypothetical protein COU49_02735 [Candidatus Nomurabacteria bacterium CG10_big_fil_rev_8_21_14_0_10_35_16]|uniref:Uncharacterized protein n=1 Tax=Candidatus Nomurabacteria bacterium CG10_big_fil_rev_8_21_14_0_10_35_16 TaxID=1974731 RepID=A0A2H0TAL7_9BACT|nr:MAG: hypothetical protein COU49_02735 [Candidatus Nomurabacteria bacterium CG10_big_fil_rev_8_21_14_0_10_35_16]
MSQTTLIHSSTKVISWGKKIILPATTGEELFSTATGIAIGVTTMGFLEANGFNSPGTPTDPVRVHVRQHRDNGTFLQMFGGLKSGLCKLCFQQGQVLAFAKKYRTWLHSSPGVETFSLVAMNEHLFVAGLWPGNELGSVGLSMHPFEYDCIWPEWRRHRMITPVIQH